MSLDQLSQLTRLHASLEDDIASLEEQLNKKKEQFRRLIEEDIPSLMLELGVKKYVFEDGSSVQVKNDLTGSIKNGDKATAFAWLMENNHDDIISNDITVKLGVGDTQAFQGVYSWLADGGYEFENKPAVHPSRLKSFLKEELANGTDVPLDLFGFYPVNKATVKKGK
jgi:hypothetical protein